jgi:hypothetical protein
MNTGTGSTLQSGNPTTPGSTLSSERPTFSTPLTGSHVRVRRETDLVSHPNVLSESTRDVDHATEATSVKRRLASGPISSEPTEPYLIDGLEKWEGIVERIYSKQFSARLIRTLGGDSEELEAEFDSSLVASSDRDLYTEGAIFYLTVRTVVNNRGNRHRTASVAFRRSGRWTSADIDKIESDIDALTRAIADVF